MPRLSRNPGFDIRDEPGDFDDLARPHLPLQPDPAEALPEPAGRPVDEPLQEGGRSRRRAAVAIALALTAGATTTLVARDPGGSPVAAPVDAEPPVPMRARAPEVRRPADKPAVREPQARPRRAAHRRARPPAPVPTRQLPATREPAMAPAPVASAAPRTPVAASKPAGGEFVLGAR